MCIIAITYLYLKYIVIGLALLDTFFKESVYKQITFFALYYYFLLILYIYNIYIYLYQ